jgi:uncharacterized protein (TIGR03000 family)
MRSLHLHLVVSIGLVGLMPRTLPAATPGAQSATIIVHLPGDAKLTIDGAPTRSTSAERSFITPPLEVGKTFSYTLQAQFVRGDQTISVTKEIAVRAGENAFISLGQPWMSAATPAYDYGAAPNISRPSAFDLRSHFRDMTADEDSVRD